MNIGTASVGWRTVSPNAVETLVAAHLKGTKERQLVARRHIPLNRLTLFQSKVIHFLLPRSRQQTKRSDILKVTVEKCCRSVFQPAMLTQLNYCLVVLNR